MEPQEGARRADGEHGEDPGGEDPEGEDPGGQHPGGQDPRGPPDDPSYETVHDDAEEGNRLMNEALQQEDEFLEYLMSLPVSQASAEKKRPLAAAASSEAGGEDPGPGPAPPRMGLEHLDNLCKLMEQLGDLREQNSKLQRRVQYLEDLKSLQEMHKRLQESLECKRRALAGCIAGGAAQEGPWGPRAVPPAEEETWHIDSLRRRRARSRSVGHEEEARDGSGGRPRRGNAKVSRWARVREAVKWEKARLEAGAVPGPQGSPRWHDHCPIDCPYHEYSYQMSSSSTSSESLLGVGVLQCGAAGEVGPHRSASATDSTADKLLLECSPHPRRRSLSPRPEEDAARRSKSLDCEDIQRALIAEKGCSASKKSHRTPWGKVKDIIQTRKESVKRREEGGLRRAEWADGDGQHSPRPPSPQAARPQPPSASPQQPRREARCRKEPHAVQCHAMGGVVAPRPPSKWTKVKKAFLTSRKEGDGRPGAVDPRMRLSYSECEVQQHGPNQSGGGSRVAAESQPGAQETPSDPENWSPTPAPSESRVPRGGHPTQADVQKNYGELQQTLSLEFHKKLSEWERMKGAGGGVAPGGGGGEWRKAKGGRGGGAPDETHLLSLDFRKKLSDWRVARGDAARPDAQRTSSLPEHRLPPPQFRKRLAEWQLWRAVAGKSGQANVEELHKILPEEFCRKLGEWERIKSGVPGEGGGAGGGAPAAASGESARKDASAIGRVVRRMRTGEVERWQQRGEALRESKNRGKEVQWLHKELQKVEREKLRLEREREKYLEREARLERMRRAMGQCPPGKQEVLIQTSTGFFRFHGISEKFTRKLYEWEKQRGIGPEASTFTLLDPTYIPLSPVGRNTTPDGLNASAIAPSSTPPNILTYQQLVSLPRSRSEGSVAESNPTSGGLVHSHSSSLGHVDSKETSCLVEQEVPSRASSEPRLRSEVRGVAEDTEDEEGTEALLVEVEDVVEETAAVLEHLPKLPSQMPIYSYAPEEVTRLIDSSGSESEKDGKCSARVNRTSSVRTQSSYELIEENMTLINKLKMKEDICRELENEIEDLEEKIQGIAKTHKEELERLRMEETGLEGKTKEQSGITEDVGTCSGRALPTSHTDMVARLKLRVNELERCQEQLKQEEENLQVHSEQQAALAQNLVGKMKQLHEVSKAVGEQEEWGDGDGDSSAELSREMIEASLTDFHSMALVQNLSTELLQLAEKLEVALADRNQEIRSLRHELQDRQKTNQSCNEGIKDTAAVNEPVQNLASPDKVCQPFREKPINYGEYKMKTFTKTMIPRQSSEELAELPFLLTNKVLELKQELSRLCIPQEPAITLSPREHPSRGKLQKTKNFQLSDEALTGDAEDAGTDVTPPPSQATSHSEERDARGGVGHHSSEQGADGASERPAPAEGVAEDCPRSPYSHLDTGRRKSSDCISTPPSERTRSPSVSSVEEWKGSVASWHETACVGAVAGGSEAKWSAATGSGDEKGESEETESDESGPASCAAVEVCLKARRVSDTHVAYKAACAAAITESSTRRTEGNGATDRGSAGGAPFTPQALETYPLPHTIPLAPASPNAASRDPAPNVFVQTTRKIFSPICGEPKGNVISYVVGFPAETDEASGGKGPWRKGKLPAPERTPPSPRPASHRRPPSAEQALAEGPAASTAAHPLPAPPPIAGRRDKGKEAAPSIRLMIAKYDRKEAACGRSAEPGVLTPGGRSPAWLSPTADRRDFFAAGGVKAQMEKYQDEVRRALLGFSNPEVATVQKSASAGIIRSLGVGPNLKPPLHSIAKSSSAGAIKSASRPKVPFAAKSPAPLFPSRLEAEVEKVEDTTSPINDSIERTLQVLRERHSSPPASPPRSQKFAHLRALRLRKAKEEFMTRNAAGDERSIGGSRFPSLSSVGTGSSSPVARVGIQEGDGGSAGGLKGESVEWGEGGRAAEKTSTGVTSRHSQISFGSESSYDDSVAVQEGLTKSASSGMIDLYSQKCKQAPLAKVVEKDGGNNDGPSVDSPYKCAPVTSESPGVPGSSKMGILSKFRKVKMRTKKMGAITALCRQSLLVNVNKEGGGREAANAGVAREMEPEGGGQHKGKPVMSYSVPSCRSCPSSPVPSSKKPENSGCWLHTPKHIFKPQKD